MKTQFHFAGFSWPRHVVELPKGTPYARLQARKFDKAHVAASPYYHAPAPIMRGSSRSFYLGSAGAPDLRWQYADEVEGARIKHEGWFTDPYGAGDTIRGVVFRLPHARGFLYGWTYGDGMIATTNCDIWPGDDIAGAAVAADQDAERAAESEREYQERWSAAKALDDDIADACEALTAARASWTSAARARQDARRAGATIAADALSATMRKEHARFKEHAGTLRELRARLPDFADVER
jgi:hypothetical protein